MTLPDNNPKTAIGRSKPPVHAIPPVALLHAGIAMENGEGKYGLMNWRDKKVSASVYYDAAMRHLMSWWDGEDQARDSKVHHLGHVIACLAILLDAEAVGNLNDDRPIKGVTADVIDKLQLERLGQAPAKPAPAPQAKPLFAEMSRDYPAHATPEVQPPPAGPHLRTGLRLVGNTLYFEHIALASLVDHPGLYSSAKERLEQYILDLNGHPSPGQEIGKLRAQLSEGSDG